MEILFLKVSDQNDVVFYKEIWFLEILPTNISNEENNNEKFDANRDVNNTNPTACVSSG